MFSVHFHLHERKQRDRGTETDGQILHPLILTQWPQQGQAKAREPRSPSQSPSWATATQALESSFDSSQDAFARSWTANGVSYTQADPLIRVVGETDPSIACYDTAPIGLHDSSKLKVISGSRLLALVHVHPSFKSFIENVYDEKTMHGFKNICTKINFFKNILFSE